MPEVWLNGDFIPDDDATVSIHDGGLLHAIGVFTTMRAVDSKVERLPQHLQRVRHDADALGVPVTFDDDALTAAVGQLLERNGLTDSRLRLTFTRGVAETGPATGASKPTAFITATEFAPYPDDFYDRGMTVKLVDDQKVNPYDPQAGHKTLNYASRFAALRNAARAGCGEALLFNVHNFLSSACVANVFVVKDNTLLTPPTNADLGDEAIKDKCPYPKSAVLPGTTRGAVLHLAEAAGIQTIRAGIDVNFLLEADEVFITNSAMGVMPVTKLEAKDLGEVGPITRQLREALDESR
ncbi:MAG: aminotransferase class IV [Planctomycetota bacterium]